jgi:23S rRNA A1618 N6-methylase RlmF
MSRRGAAAHPRNVLRNGPDLAALVAAHGELRKYFRFSRQVAMQRRTDRFMWEDADAVRCLTVAMLHYYFQLTVDVPPAHLLPHLTLRLNYVHFLEDLLNLQNSSSDVPAAQSDSSTILIHGIDIGTGATCIFPLLLARLHPALRWIATEINPESFRIAARNWHINFGPGAQTSSQPPLDLPSDATELDSGALSLRLVPQTDDSQSPSILLCALKGNERALFSMCNPPFFESVDAKQVRGKRSFRAVDSEVATEGGEYAFVMQMIDESLQLRARIGTYTTMLGRQSTLPAVMKRLRECDDVSEHGNTELWQGKICRSVVWWRVKQQE